MTDSSRSAQGDHDERWARLARKLEDAPSDEAQLPDSADARDSLPSSPTVPPQIRRLGDFDLIEKLGEGGMGTVYLARQCSLGNKPVAVKVLPPYFAFDPKRIARFRTEATNASKVNHAGIVSVLQVGEQHGMHFIVQELVEGGRSLADRIRETRDAVDFPKNYYRTTAELFAKVADALHALHATQVIHRDIKPSNILLTPQGEPKLADFGLAKDLEGAGALTSGESPGTPCYKCPEQIDRRVGAVDARSDVFALGVTLYEALTFTRPFDGDEHAEIYQKIRYASIESPKAKRPGVPDEPALICMKALEKEPARRYQTARELAADLRRYLDDEPIHAKQPSVASRVRLWAKRNVVAAALSVASIVVIATASIAVSTVYSKNEDLEAQKQLAENRRVRAEQSEADAEARAAEALASERRAERVAEFVQHALKNSDPNQGGAQNYRVVDAMDKAIAELDRHSLKDDPEIETSIQSTIAQILDGNGRSEDALRLEKLALATQLRLHRGDYSGTADRLNNVACYLHSLGRDEEALARFEQALAMRQRLFFGDHPDVAESLNNIALCLNTLGRSEEACPKIEVALAMRRRLFSGDHPDIARNLNNLAGCLDLLGRSEEALPKYEEALAMLKRLYACDHPDVATNLNNVGYCLDLLGHSEEALPKFEEALAMSQRLFSGDHRDVARNLNNVASCLDLLGHSEEAFPKFEEARAMRRRLFSGDHPELADSINSIAFCLRSLGRSDEALLKFEEALAMRRRLFSGDHPEVADSINNIAFYMNSLGRTEEALLKFEEALAMRQRLYSGDHPNLAGSLNNVAFCLDSLGRSGEALPKFEEALAMRRRLFARDHQDVADNLMNIGFCLNSLGRSEEALPQLKEALAIRQRLFSGDHRDVADSLSSAASCLHRLGCNEEALTNYEAALAMRQRLFEGDHPDVALSLNNVAFCLDSLGRSEEAIAYAEGAAAMAARLFPADHPQRQRIESVLARVRGGQGRR